VLFTNVKLLVLRADIPALLQSAVFPDTVLLVKVKVVEGAVEKF